MYIVPMVRYLYYIGCMANKSMFALFYPIICYIYSLLFSYKKITINSLNNANINDIVNKLECFYDAFLQSVSLDGAFKINITLQCIYNIVRF